MKNNRAIWRLAAVSFFALSRSVFANPIQLAAAMLPSSLQVDQSSALLISVTNVAPGSDALVHYGDVLQFYPSLGDGAIRSINTNLLLGGGTFQSGDWTKGCRCLTVGKFWIVAGSRKHRASNVANV